MMLMACGSNSDGTGTVDSGNDGTPGDDSGTNDSGTNGTDDSGTVDDTGEAASIARGAAIVQDVCSHCHSSASLAQRAAGLDDATITSVIENGFGSMPPQNLDAQQIADVIAYLRSVGGNAPIGREAPDSSAAAL
jgi:mono/diheme cytochrome c family protein